MSKFGAALVNVNEYQIDRKVLSAGTGAQAIPSRC